jgi:hypothetical protein
MKKRIVYQILNNKGTIDTSIANEFLDERQLDALFICCEPLDFLIQIITSYDCLQRNYQDFQRFTDKLLSGEDKLVSCGINFCEAMNLMSELQQRVLNVLSSSNAFLSLSEAKLKSQFPEKFDVWNQKKQGLHSSYVSYRILYTLRNYTLHYGLPVTTLNVSKSELLSDAPNKVVQVFLIKSVLLGTSFKWGNVKKDLETQENQIQLLPMLNEYMGVLKELFSYLLKIFKDELELSSDALKIFYQINAIPTESNVFVINSDDLFISETGINFNQCQSVPTYKLTWVLQKSKEFCGQNFS